jgi:hypothetical protein
VHWWRWRERRENDAKRARNQVLHGDYSRFKIASVDRHMSTASDRI